MKLKNDRVKYGTTDRNLQGQLYSFQVYVTCAVMAVVLALASRAEAQTTSPLEILNQAPKVRIEETPAYAPPPNVPYVPPRGPAPPIETVAPAITPYNGNSVSGRTPDYLQYGGPVAPPPGMAEPGSMRPPPTGPTPRPVLGPEDVERQKPKKRGFVRGLINAIPFVGDDEEEATPTPTPMAGRTYERLPNNTSAGQSPIYRGYEPAEAPPPSSGEPLLRAPGTESIDAAPTNEVVSPPIMTPTPRGGVMEPDEPATGPGIAPVDDIRPVLTVKRESESTETQTGTPVEGTEKKPAMSPSVDEVTPSRETQQTSSVLIENADAEVIGASQPVVAPETPVVVADSLTTAADELTSLTVEQADLGMPNPTYEQNSTILGEFQAAVRSARGDNYPNAAQQFREYAANHPSSGLAPRALYLSIVFEKNNAKAKESYESLQRLFPKSHYVEASAKRRPEVLAGTEPKKAAVAGVEAAVAETPQQKVARLEKELTVAVGNLTLEPELRGDLGAAYIEMEEFDRAWEVLRPAVDMTAGKPEEGKILLLMARCQMARRDTDRALAIVEIVEQKYPGTIMTDAASAWNAGLAFESGARYAKARAIYNEIRAKWPGTAEAGWAEARLRDLAVLVQ